MKATHTHTHTHTHTTHTHTLHTHVLSILEYQLAIAAYKVILLSKNKVVIILSLHTAYICAIVAGEAATASSVLCLQVADTITLSRAVSSR